MLGSLKYNALIPVIVVTAAAALALYMGAQGNAAVGGIVIGVSAAFALIYQVALFGPLDRLADKIERAKDGAAMGDTSSQDEVGRIWRAGAELQNKATRSQKQLEQSERELERFAEYFGELATHGLCDDRAKFETKSKPLLACLDAIEEMRQSMAAMQSRAGELARGELELGELEPSKMATLRLSDLDESLDGIDHELERSFVELNNQMRRLAVQANMIAADKLESPLLDESLPGELGVAFAEMVENLRGLSTRAQNIARGDLSTYTDESGDLHNAFNTMVQSLREIIDQITQTAVRISTSAEEILAVLREQELSASHQASGVEETQRTMETLLSSAKKIAESAQTVFKSAERTQANNRTISDRASELKSHTERIGEILESIKEIADRSDLLALNASLEGLRAGEAGKGFTLVANEMRRLAENIKGSVGDIKELLSDIRESALSSVLAIEEGTRLSERTTDSALKITLITQQQQSGTEQVTQSMEELSHLINQGLAGTRQVTTAASELAELSEDLRKIVDSFQIEGISGQPRATAQPTRTWSTPARAPYSAQPLSAHSAHDVSPQTRPHNATTSPTQPVKEETPRSKRATMRMSRPTLTAPDAEALPSQVDRPNSASSGRKLQVSEFKLPSGEELNATMRFVGYDAQNELLTELTRGEPATTRVGVAGLEDSSGYDDVDNLFDDMKGSPSADDPDTAEAPIADGEIEQS